MNHHNPLIYHQLSTMNHHYKPSRRFIHHHPWLITSVPVEGTFHRRAPWRPREVPWPVAFGEGLNSLRPPRTRPRTMNYYLWLYRLHLYELLSDPWTKKIQKGVEDLKILKIVKSLKFGWRSLVEELHLLRKVLLGIRDRYDRDVTVETAGASWSTPWLFHLTKIDFTDCQIELETPKSSTCLSRVWFSFICTKHTNFWYRLFLDLKSPMGCSMFVSYFARMAFQMAVWLCPKVVDPPQSHWWLPKLWWPPLTIISPLTLYINYINHYQ